MCGQVYNTRKRRERERNTSTALSFFFFLEVRTTLPIWYVCIPHPKCVERGTAGVSWEKLSSSAGEMRVFFILRDVYTLYTSYTVNEVWLNLISGWNRSTCHLRGILSIYIFFSPFFFVFFSTTTKIPFVAKKTAWTAFTATDIFF